MQTRIIGNWDELSARYHYQIVTQFGEDDNPQLFEPDLTSYTLEGLTEAVDHIVGAFFIPIIRYRDGNREEVSIITLAREDHEQIRNWRQNLRDEGR